MSPFTPDGEWLDMTARRAAGMRLITEAIAREIARLVVANEHGEDELKAQLPFSVDPEADAWVVRGSRPMMVGSDFSKLNGPLEMRISQFTGQIFTCHFQFYLPTPEGAPIQSQPR
ncbi:MAG: hypothetical protein ACLQE9_19910 [Roseiarcus sp.]